MLHLFKALLLLNQTFLFSNRTNKAQRLVVTWTKYIFICEIKPLYCGSQHLYYCTNMTLSYWLVIRSESKTSLMPQRRNSIFCNVLEGVVVTEHWLQPLSMNTAAENTHRKIQPFITNNYNVSRKMHQRNC